MCGIAGIIGRRGSCLHNTSVIKSMIDVQHHRGPDDNGILGISGNPAEFKEYSTSSVVPTHLDCMALMGFVRLSIRDLSIQGHQPMIDKARKVSISFNGEIYNADEIREVLKRKGHYFRSSTDTEVILEAYLEFGFEKTIKMLNGMFAIVIADLNTERYYLARDRVGIKPLYYTLKDGMLIYSSEIKGILQYPEISKEISKEALFEKMMYRGATIPSLFKSIEWVEPGTYCTLDFKGNFKKNPFFDINDYTRREAGEFNNDKKMLEEVLSDCIKRQMISDVKVGCQLSGGVDSSLVCWYAKKENPEFMNDTISIISPIKEFSEEIWIDEVNKKLGMSEHKFMLDTNRVMDTLPTTIWHLETILTQPNSLGILQISEHAKDYVTVLLSGEGADEMMGGYECWYESLSYLWKCSKNKKNISVYEDYVINMEIDPDLEWNSRILLDFDAEQVKNHRYNILKKMSGDPYTRVMKYHYKTYLPELLLRQDKMSMANSIENRVPILDNEMIDFLFELPIEELIRENIKIPRPANVIRNKKRAFWKTNCKYILKEMCADKYGKQFAYRRKMGFPMPIISFMSSASFNEKFHDVWLPNIYRRDIFDGEELKKLFAKQETLSYAESETLWRVLTFEMWCEQFVD